MVVLSFTDLCAVICIELYCMDGVQHKTEQKYRLPNGYELYFSRCIKQFFHLLPEIGLCLHPDISIPRFIFDIYFAFMKTKLC